MNAPRYKNATHLSIRLDADTMRMLHSIIRKNTTLERGAPSRSEVVRVAIAALYGRDDRLDQVQTAFDL